MGKEAKPGAGTRPGRAATSRSGKMDPMIEELVKRFARLEQWFKAPLFECRRCGRLFEAMTEMNVPKKGGYFDIRVRMCRVTKMKDDPRLMWSLDQCIGCKPKEKGSSDGKG